MEIINQFLEHSKPIHEILRCIRTKTEAMVHGVSDTQKRHLAFYLARNAGLKGIYIAWNEMQARQALADLAYLTEDRVVFLPDKDIMLYDVEARSYDQTYGRISALVAFSRAI
jgi:transcription-repair coupling factor (superfamily II helicase)